MFFTPSARKKILYIQRKKEENVSDHVYTITTNLITFTLGLCSDLAEISGASETLAVWHKTESENGEATFNGKPSDELLVTMPFAGTSFTVRLLFYLQEPWMPPDISFSDIQFLSRLSAQDLTEQVGNVQECVRYELYFSFMY